VDFALQAVAQARRRLVRKGIPGEVRVGDVSRLETVQGSYDLVLDIGCYHGLDQWGKLPILSKLKHEPNTHLGGANASFVACDRFYLFCRMQCTG
jgi:hypothetical protein